MSRKGNTSLEVTIDHDISIPRVVSPQPAFSKIFSNMLAESHMLVSIIRETLRPFPRFVRTFLLFTELYLQLFFACFFACLWGNYKGIDFISLWVVVLSQIIVTIIGNINRTSNKSLRKATNTAEFIQITKRIEKKIKIKWIITLIVCMGVMVTSSGYSVVFFARSHGAVRLNAVVIFSVAGFIDLAVFQVLEALALSCVKYLSYKSKIMKQLSGVLKKARVWKSTNPDFDR